ncbi:heavy-metal-associated domain-containing protein [Leeia oryzae]|uniref:heavy-metal-associated domain-containing protein n=1 Tax=Leeia oryzae TaxID=356662 RepID=UPI0003661E84|nr:heavy-metal-associated domain-containing protein [Leeia oryzae]
MTDVTLKIEGMTCGGCVASVKRVLEAEAGVSAVVVSLEKKQADLQLDTAANSVEHLVSAIEDAGYDVVR